MLVGNSFQAISIPSPPGYRVVPGGQNEGITNPSIAKLFPPLSVKLLLWTSDRFNLSELYIKIFLGGKGNRARGYESINRQAIPSPFC